MSRPPDDSNDASDDSTTAGHAGGEPTAVHDHTDCEPTAVDSSSDGSTAVDEYLPDAAVESRWWYWIAAVPVFFVLSVVFGVVFVGTFVLGLFIGDGGAAVVLFVLAGLFALTGLVLSILFPLAVYVDAQAVSRADVDWDPDPVLYGLVALAGVVVTAFVVSVPLALYYLYRRHGAVGVP